MKFALRCSVVFASVLLTTSAFAATWFPYGPDGGDARAFAADPHDHNHLYLGTINGWIYDTHDGGTSWKRLARVGNRDDLALDNIIVDPADPKHVTVGAWVLGSADGGLFVSTDAGATWTSNADMQHESIRALSSAPSDSKILIAGTLKGIFQSVDNGSHWKLISPAGSAELHEVESIAIDPVDPKTIYAGTWHLPWKTTDGGATWHNIKQGIIEDSDVFSIIVDPKKPNVVYASACSGIYRSETAGEKFVKVQGIPTTARRTRVLMQDPSHPSTVYAGTTQGLFRTDDSGAHWVQATGSDIIINDVFVDPSDSKRVMMATDRSGVLTSNDNAVTFSPSNKGFSSRQITSFAADPQHPSEIFVGVVNDKKFGGAFLSTDGGLAWTQRADGLEGHDVFSLAEAPNGGFVAGTEHGVYFYTPETKIWNRTGMISVPPAVKATAPSRKTARGAAKPAVVRKPVQPKVEAPTKIDDAVLDMGRVGDQVYAVTVHGVYSAADPQHDWKKVEGPADEPWRFIASAQSVALVASLKTMTLSTDAGSTWHAITGPSGLTQIGTIAVDDKGELWAGGREGIFLSSDQGSTWTTLHNFFVSDVNNIFYDHAGQRLLVTAHGTSTMVFAFHTPDQTLKYWDSGWNLRFARPVGDYLIGVTMFDGVVVQPRMVESKELASH